MSFLEWLGKRFRRYGWIAATASVLATIIGFTRALPIEGVLGFLSFVKTNASPISFVLQFLTIFVFIFVRPKNPPIDKYKRASKAVDQLVHAWVFVWLFWLVFYFVFSAHFLAVQHDLEFAKQGVSHHGIFILENLFNNLPTIAILICYVVLSVPTVSPAGMDERLPWPEFIFAVVGVACAEGLLSFYQPIAEPAHFIFRSMSGVGQGVAIALLVGRLDNRFLDPPRILVIVLYVYAVIQTGFIGFSYGMIPTSSAGSTDPTFSLGGTAPTILLINAALIGKCALYLLLAWLLESHILLFYCSEVAHLISDVPLARKEFIAELLQAAGTRRTNLKRFEEIGTELSVDLVPPADRLRGITTRVARAERQRFAVLNEIEIQKILKPVCLAAKLLVTSHEKLDADVKKGLEGIVSAESSRASEVIEALRKLDSLVPWPTMETGTDEPSAITFRLIHLTWDCASRYYYGREENTGK